MIATWMLYCSLCALGLSAAAAIAERSLLSGRAPVRFIWIGAVALSLLVPVAALRFAPRQEPASSVTTISHDIVADQVLDGSVASSAPIAAPPRSSSSGRDWRATLARFDQPLAVAWVTLSLAVAFSFFGGIVVLAWMRRGWQRRLVLGVPVFVSERTGPAVVGAVAPAIVVPEWVLALEPRQLALMLRHEQEHQRAGDVRLLTAAQLALIVMPWNLALWWQILRLRGAVELDCDARVLQDADARIYGDLLLEVARPRRGPIFMGATAFAERATQLERRIRVLPRHRVRTSRAARAMATGIGLSAVTAAWIAPRPSVPARAPTSPSAPALGAPPPAITAPAMSTSRDSSIGRPRETKRTSGVAAKTLRDSAMPVELAATPPSAIIDSARGARLAAPVDSIFDRLFEGIRLAPDKEATARDMLTTLELEQLRLDREIALTVLTNQVKRVLLLAQRDTALRALLTNDADRATFDARAAQPQGRGRRSGGPPPDSLGGGQRGGGRGGGGGRIGGGGRGPGGLAYDSLISAVGGRVGGGGGGRARGGGALIPPDVLAQVNERVGALMAEATFRSLFDGIALTTDQEATARALITKTQQDMPQMPRFEVRIRVNPMGLVTMQAASAAALMALVDSDADRTKLQSRIVTIPHQERGPPGGEHHSTGDDHDNAEENRRPERSFGPNPR